MFKITEEEIHYMKRIKTNKEENIESFLNILTFTSSIMVAIRKVSFSFVINLLILITHISLVSCSPKKNKLKLNFESKDKDMIKKNNPVVDPSEIQALKTEPVEDKTQPIVLATETKSKIKRIIITNIFKNRARYPFYAYEDFDNEKVIK